MVPRKPKRITVVVPAHNEGSRFNGIGHESHIHDVLKPLKEWREAHPNRENINLLVVNDGSHDDTAHLVKEAGVELIHSDPKNPENNMGKAEAIRRGASHARDVHKSEVMVMLDADIKNLEGENIDKLMKPVLKDGYHMSVAQSSEGMQFSLPESGNRAIRLSALNPWLNGNPKWKGVKGFGIEHGLNTLIPKSKQKFLSGGSYFSQDIPYRGSDSAGRRQSEEIGVTRRALEDRVYPVNQITKLRAEGKNKEAREFAANWHNERGEKTALHKVRAKKKKS